MITHQPAAAQSCFSAFRATSSAVEGRGPRVLLISQARTSHGKELRIEGPCLLQLQVEALTKFSGLDLVLHL